MADSIDKTALYDGWPSLPPLVARAVALARRMGFAHSCIPEQGELLRVLARGRDGGRIGETGTGCGVGLAWMAGAVGPGTSLVSVERDPARAAACRELFRDCPNVMVLEADWRELIAWGPFDLLVLDGGGGGKQVEAAFADPDVLLTPAGTVVLDDMHPPFDGALTSGTARSGDGRDLERCRRHWFGHPGLLASELRLHPLMSTIVATRKGP